MSPAGLASLVWIQSIPEAELARVYALLAAMPDSPIARSSAATLGQILAGEIIEEIDLLGLAFVLLRTQSKP